VNTNQTDIHLVPTNGTRTWEEKGSRHVNIHGVTVATKDKVLLFQVIFQGLTTLSLPPLNDRKSACLDSRWNLIFSHNHWSTIDTCKEFVDTIISSYMDSQIKDLNFLTDQQMVWLLDC
jgi:hypothetical protein